MNTPSHMSAMSSPPLLDRSFLHSIPLSRMHLQRYEKERNEQILFIPIKRKNLLKFFCIFAAEFIIDSLKWAE